MRKLITTSFNMGQIVMTPTIKENLNMVEMMVSLGRHAACDWGNVCASDWESNNKALKNGGRLISSYTSSAGRDYWIITEADHSVTTVLYPSEY